MAISTAATAASSLFDKVSILFLTRSPIPIRCHLKPRTPKFVKLSSQFPKFPSSSLPIPHLCRSSEGFDSFEGAGVKEFVEEDEDEEEEQKVVESGDGGRLFVGNLPYSITSSELAEIFEEAGRVVSAEIVYDRVTDRSRGFAFITMGSVEEAKEAIRMFEGSQIGGRTVKVNFPEVPRGGEREVMGPKIRSSNRGYTDSPHKIYAGNLGWRLTSEGLADAFANQPGLLSAKVIYERDTGRSRGFGFVTFETAEAVQSALEAMNGVELEGRPMRLNMAAERAQPPIPEKNREENLVDSDLFSSINT